MDLMEAPQKIIHSNLWGETFSFPNTRKLKLYTHKVFNRYPARSISIVPKQLLESFTKENGVGNLLDPFMGSGTTAIEGLLAGFNVFGVEIDPFARLITEVSIQSFSESELLELSRLYREISKIWPTLEADENLTPRLKNISYWFSEENFVNLLKLKTSIYKVCNSEKELNFFRLVLADIVRPCSKAERQSLKPYISTKFIKVPSKVGDSFEKSFNIYHNAVDEFSKEHIESIDKFKWAGENALNFSVEQLIDIAITSPPYLNSIDYTRCIKIESAWIECADDFTIKTVKNGQVGDESRRSNNKKTFNLIQPYIDQLSLLDERRANIATCYFEDMYKNLECVYNSLRNGGKYCLIIGNSKMRGVNFPTHELIAKLGEDLGFVWTGYYKYKLKDHRLSIPRKNNISGGKIEYEHVITLQKPI